MRGIDGAAFFQRESPLVRHVVLRKRAMLGERKLLERIAVNIHPDAGLAKQPQRFTVLFQGLALRRTTAFDHAYGQARELGTVLTHRGQGTGFMKNLMEQRVCSSVAAGLSTARKLLAGRTVEEQTDELELELEQVVQSDAERAALEPLLEAV